MPTDSPERDPAPPTQQEDSPLSFAIEARIPGAGGRAGTLTLPHGTVETPAFMVVGTQATVKSLTPEEVRGLGTQMILGNAYHLTDR
jgi:queuine tRNA-ribosyltransferase